MNGVTCIHTSTLVVWSSYKALEALNKRDLTEIRSFARPPILVERVLEAVMILRKSEPTWNEAKRQLSKLVEDCVCPSVGGVRPSVCRLCPLSLSNGPGIEHWMCT